MAKDLSYLVWLSTSSVSFLLSLGVLLSILLKRGVWGKIFYQLSAAMAIADLVGSSSWFYGEKYDEPYVTCAIEEYMLQGSFLAKGAITVVICYVSMQVINTMRIPSTCYIMSCLVVALLLAMGILACSISVQTAEIFCNDDFEKFRSFKANSRTMGYLMFFALPVYICVIIDFMIYITLLSKVRKLSAHPMYSEDSEENRLFIVVRRLLFYPVIFSLVLLPEAAVVILSLVTGRINRILLVAAAGAMGISGAMVAMNFFIYQHNLLPDLRQIFLSSDGGAFVAIGRSISSILNWSETNTSSALHSSHDSSRATESGIDMGMWRDSVGSSRTSDWRQTFSSDLSESDCTISTISAIQTASAGFSEQRHGHVVADKGPFGQHWDQSSITGFTHSRSVDMSSTSSSNQRK